MSYYAQKVYQQHLGNSHYTIADVGCLLTSVCNGLVKLNGQAPDPPTLNQELLNRGLFVFDRPDNAFDDLSWNTISQLDPSITVVEVGAGPLPTSNNAIVKFHYIGIHTGQPVDHYCWVDRVENGRVFIIDSWDGIVKAPEAYEGVYHKPTAWATYTKHAPVPAPAPAPVAPPSPPPAGAIPYPSSTEKYSISKTLLGFGTATDAGNHTNAKGIVDAGSYYVFKTYPGKDYLKNVTKILGQPGSWINANDNVPDPVPAPAPLPPPPDKASPALAPQEYTPPPVQADASTTPNSWRTSYHAFRQDDKNPTSPALPRKYVIMWPLTPIYNADSGQTKVIGKAGTPSVQFEDIWIAGTVMKDKVAYFRPQRNNADKGLWWLIPQHDPLGRPYLMPENDVYNSSTSTAERLALRAPSLIDRLAKTWEEVSSKVIKIKVK